MSMDLPLCSQTILHSIENAAEWSHAMAMLNDPRGDKDLSRIRLRSFSSKAASYSNDNKSERLAQRV